MTSPSAAAIESCCANLYGNPLLELIAGQSLHPGGLATTRRLLAEARLRRGTRLLDAGCGLGASARLAALDFGLTVDACDVSPTALRRAAALAADAGATIRFSEASLLRLPYADGAFGAVLSECVLSATDKRTALAELRRVTANGGALLISDVTAADPIVAPEPLASALCLSQAWRATEMEDVIGSMGYVVARAWDETTEISRLIDRLEARAGLFVVLARDAQSQPLGGFAEELARLPSPQRVGTAVAEARRLVREGRIGYRAVIARLH